MKHVMTMTRATLAFLLVSGCGAGNDVGAAEGVESDEPGAAAPVEDSAALTGAETGTSNAPAQAEVAASVDVSRVDLARVDLARIEFTDGNVVRFEELDGGVLVSEMGSDLNPRHLVPKEGLTALEAFKALAPGRAVPAALMQMHERLYPAGRTLTVGQSTRAAAGAKPAGERPSLDPDLEHNGEFQQSYPAETFLQVMCDFPTGGGELQAHESDRSAHGRLARRPYHLLRRWLGHRHDHGDTVRGQE